jgi:NitT/TauT family transport system substrate-binding protein
MKRMNGWFVALVFVMLCAPAMAQEKVVLGMSGWTGFAPLSLADKAGIFKKNGVDVELKFMPQPARLAALAAGDLNAAATTVDTHVVWATKVPMVQVLLLDKSNGGDGLVVRNTIQSVKELKGKTIAVDGAGTVPHFMLTYILEKNGLSLQDVIRVTLGPQQAAQTFLAGQYDAAMTYEPYMSQVRGRADQGKILVTTKDYPVVIDTLAFKADFVKKNPKVVQAVVNSFFEALTMIKTDQAKAYELMGSAVKQTGPQFGGSAQFIQWQDKAANQDYFAKESLGFSKTAGDILKANRVINALPDYKAMQDASFIK